MYIPQSLSSWLAAKLQCNALTVESDRPTSCPLLSSSKHSPYLPFAHQRHRTWGDPAVPYKASHNPTPHPYSPLPVNVYACIPVYAGFQSCRFVHIPWLYTQLLGGIKATYTFYMCKRHRQPRSWCAAGSLWQLRHQQEKRIWKTYYTQVEVKGARDQ